MHISPRWGFSSFEINGHNNVAPPELKNGSSAAARDSQGVRVNFAVP